MRETLGWFRGTPSDSPHTAEKKTLGVDAPDWLGSVTRRLFSLSPLNRTAADDIRSFPGIRETVFLKGIADAMKDFQDVKWKGGLYNITRPKESHASSKKRKEGFWFRTHVPYEPATNSSALLNWPYFEFETYKWKEQDKYVRWVVHNVTRDFIRHAPSRGSDFPLLELLKQSNQLICVVVHDPQRNVDVMISRDTDSARDEMFVTLQDTTTRDKPEHIESTVTPARAFEYAKGLLLPKDGSMPFQNWRRMLIRSTYYNNNVYDIHLHMAGEGM